MRLVSRAGKRLDAATTTYDHAQQWNRIQLHTSDPDSVTAMSNDDYPLITLHPVADNHHRWVGLLVQGVNSDTDTDALVRLFGEFGLFESLGHLPCVLPLPQPEVLTPTLADLLPAEKVILQLPTAHCVNPAHATALAGFRSQGFHLIAHGQLASGAQLPSAVQALAADYPVDADIAGAATSLPGLSGPHLALHVNDGASFERACKAGFRWIAGNYPLHLATEKTSATSPGRAIMLKLLSQITGDADSHDIEKTLKQDPNLSYQLLKLVNSVAFSLTTKISNFSQAITLLGRRQLQRWLQLLLYAHPAGRGDEASALMPRAALRASLMEGLVRATGGNKDLQDRAFMVGMFSLLEALVGQPAAEVIRSLNLADEVTIALVAHQGVLGDFLALVEASESGPNEGTRAAMIAAGISPATWAAEQAQAFHWAIQISKEA